MHDRKNERPYESTLMLRLGGEVATKSEGIRQQFNRRLVQNLRDALKREGIDADVKDHWYRIDVKTEDRRALDVATRVFGVQAASWTRAYKWETLDDVVQIGEELFKDQVAGKTFAVRTKRAGYRDRIPFDSMDVDRALGTLLVNAGGEVNLDDHEVRVGVEVRADKAFFFEEERSAVAGLPCGVEGRAVALMSGGFDSAVAAWTMMGRGVDLDFLFFNLAGPPQERTVKEVTKLLCERWAYGYAPRFHVVDMRPMLAEMRNRVDGHYWQLLLKRLMVRAGHELARDKGYPAMVTGESCGQVSSQTLMNLGAITAPIPTAVLRPLVGMNKDDIIERARRIGTHDLCSKTPEFCALDGGPPKVDATAAELDEQEALVDRGLLSQLVKRRKTYTVLEMNVTEERDVQIDRIPDGAVILDLRDEKKHTGWAVDGAVHMPLERAVDQVSLLPKEPPYLLYCEVGLKSAYLAEAMAEMGYETYSFRGGVPKLRKYIERK